MGHIFCLMGKSASGKDTLYSSLLNDSDLSLNQIVSYTTRPIRDGETEGVQYHFTDIEGLKAMENKGIVIESRCYNTCFGDWYYFTAQDGSIKIDSEDYLIIGTLESFSKIRSYFGAENVVPLYIAIDDGIRLERALARERSQSSPKYDEMCRRFLADCQDFSDEKLQEAGIDGSSTYCNEDFDKCVKALKEKIWTLKSTR